MLDTPSAYQLHAPIWPLVVGTGVARRNANIGLGATVHQGIEISEYAMIGMGSVVTRNVPPFATVLGGAGRAVGVNRIGITRAGLDGSWVEAYEELISGERHLGEAPDVVCDAIERWRTRQDRRRDER